MSSSNTSGFYFSESIDTRSLLSYLYQILIASQNLLSVDWPADSSKISTDLTFDYIVIGAGSAGSVVASRLSEDTHRRVLLVEAGEDPPYDSLVPLASLIGTKHDWGYRTENDSKSCQGSQDGRCNFPRGKMLGGTNALGLMSYMRGHYKNYDDLEAAGNYGWNSASALEYFKKSENLYEPDIQNDATYSKYHNYNGPLGVTTFRGTHPFRKNLIEAYQEIGSDNVKDIGDLNPHGTVESLGTIKDRKRDTSAIAFLVPARDRDNLVIFKNALATKIIFDGKTAIGANIRFFNGTEITVKATTEVIVSAGVVNTPQLLMLSGIGPKKHLENMGIPVIADLAVGENLHDHIIIFTPIALNTDLYNDSPLANALDIAAYVLLQKGSYASLNCNDITSFFWVNNTTLKSIPPDIALVQVFYNRNASVFPVHCREYLRYSDEICDYYDTVSIKHDILPVTSTLYNVKSRGKIELASTNPLDYPKIHANYFSAPEDIDNIIKSVDILQQLVNSPTMRSLGAEIPRVSISNCNDLTFNTKKYWECIVFNMGTSMYDPMGTAKMGPASDPKAVVDPELRVHGINNLRVVDASVFPGTISGNINAPVIMLAERASDLIKAAHS